MEEAMTWIYFIPVVLLLLFVRNFRQRNCKLPPGPSGLPIVGYLHKLGGKSLHFIMSDLADKYGPVMSLQLGSRLAIILSDHETIYEAYTKKAKLFAGRPDMASFKSTNHDSVGISLCTFGKTYQSNRKNALRGIQRMYMDSKNLDELLHKEAAKMMNYIDQSFKLHTPVDPMELFKKVVPSAFLAMMFGKDFNYDDKEFIDIVECYTTWFENAEADNPPDFFPMLEKLPNERLNIISNCGSEFERFATNKLYQYENEKRSFALIHSFYDYFGKFSSLGKQQKRNMARVVADLCGGGFDTVASTLAWAPIYLLDQPDVLTKAREEILTICGNDNIYFEKRILMPYFTATVYEILRLSSVGPLGLPRVTMETIEYRNYVIPKDTLVFVNLWKCNHDPTVWETPHKINPEHFLDENYQINDQMTKKLMAFSTGVRRCPGEKLAIQKIFILLGTLLQNYNFEFAKKPIDALPKRGVTLKPKDYTISFRKFDHLPKGPSQTFA